MAKFEINAFIRKPVEIVFRAYINPDNMVKWIKNLERLEMKMGNAGEAGATMHLHYEKRGVKNILEYHLENLEPDKYLRSIFTGDKRHVVMETIFDPVYDETELTILWNGKGKTRRETIIMALLKNKIKKQAQSELDYFKELVEKHGEVFK